jgi:hypothetical protein
MKVYRYAEARQKLADLLDRAGEEGQVVVRRRDGGGYVIQPRRAGPPPLDVEPVEADLSREEIVQAVRKSRERSAPGEGPR